MPFKGMGLPHASVQFLLNLDKAGLEEVKILALIGAGDLLSGLFLTTGAHMLQLVDGLAFSINPPCG